MEQQRMAPLLFRSITHKFFTGIIRQNCQGIENVRSLIYFFPIAINILIGGMFFISAYRFKLAEAPGWIIGATMAAWALVYSVFSLLLSRRLTRKNAPVILNTGCFILTASSAGFLFFDGLYTQFVWILTSGLANACYCAPFQLLMKSVEPDQASAGSVYLCLEYRRCHRSTAFRLAGSCNGFQDKCSVEHPSVGRGVPFDLPDTAERKKRFFPEPD